MPDAIVYLDESGDLGWKFGSPYRKGGSSRYLTIAATVIPTNKKHLTKRLMKDLYKTHGWSFTKEKKWAHMKANEKKFFATAAASLLKKHQEIICTSITVYKPKVQEHIRNDGNKLYNYMISLILLNKIKKFDNVIFVPDSRSIKVASGSSLPDYLQTKLWFELNTKTNIVYNPHDSAHSKNLQFVDMVSGSIQQNYEDKKTELLEIIKPTIAHKKLFFPSSIN